MDIVWNLISEGIGILVTVFFVDRLLQRSERRRFRHVNALILQQLEISCGDILIHWADWLAAVRKRGRKIRNPEIPRVDAKESNVATEGDATSLPFKDFEDMCRYSGDETAVGESGKALIDLVRPENFHRGLSSHLGHYALDGEDPAWRRTIRSLSQQLDKITLLLSRLPNKDPDLLEGTEGMYLTLRDIDPRTHRRQVWEDEGVREARMAEIAHHIAQTISMRKFVRATIAAESSHSDPQLESSHEVSI
jgi:hypothetical protein